MKHIVGFFLPLCIFCFVAFGISVAVLGTTPSADSENITVNDTTTFIDEDFHRIELDSELVSVKIYPTNGNKTIIRTTKSQMDSISYSVSGGALKLYFERNIKDFWDIFHTFTGVFGQSVEIYVPDKQYDNIIATVDAGSTEINGVKFANVDLELNAGSLVFANPEGYLNSSLNVELNAGNCAVYNANTQRFDIAMSAGNIDVYGLTGSGYLEVSAGNGVFNFDKLNGDISIDASAGNAELNIPENSSAIVYCDKTAGNVTVKYNGSNNSLHNDEDYIIGEGRYAINANISAGNISITDKTVQKTAPTVMTPPTTNTTNGGVVTTAVHTTNSSAYIDPVESKTE